MASHWYLRVDKIDTKEEQYGSCDEVIKRIEEIKRTNPIAEPLIRRPSSATEDEIARIREIAIDSWLDGGL